MGVFLTEIRRGARLDRAARAAGSFPELEDRMCAITYRGYEGEGSPDRLDAMFWAMGNC